MKIAQIYERFEIPKNLQEHMYRVAAVGQILVGFLKDQVPLDLDIVTTELLIHDMGNIIKFDVTNQKELKKIQENFISKYGSEEHVATEAIARELNVPEKVIEILDNTGSSRLHLTVQTSDWYRKVCSYADFRVAPYGVVSINQRFDEVLKRYAGRDHVLADVQKLKERGRMP